MSETKANTIICSVCHIKFEFEDDAVNGVGSAECLPDGVITPAGDWVCDDCMHDKDGNIKPEYD